MADTYLILIVTALVIFISYIIFKKFKKARNLVVLTGPSECGKTAVFTKIIFNKHKKSVTSLKESEATNQELNLTLVDLPGSDRLRGRYWAQYKAQARHVIFMVDASTIEAKLRDLSEYLYELLADTTIHDRKIKFTIACHKQDIEGAKGRDSIEELLDRELTAIKDTKKGQLGKTSNEENEDFLLKKYPAEIKLRNLNVGFIETSLSNLDQLIKTIL